MSRREIKVFSCRVCGRETLNLEEDFNCHPTQIVTNKENRTAFGVISPSSFDAFICKKCDQILIEAYANAFKNIPKSACKVEVTIRVEVETK